MVCKRSRIESSCPDSCVWDGFGSKIPYFKVKKDLVKCSCFCVRADQDLCLFLGRKQIKHVIGKHVVSVTRHIDSSVFPLLLLKSCEVELILKPKQDSDTQLAVVHVQVYGDVVELEVWRAEPDGPSVEGAACLAAGEEPSVKPR